MSLIIWHLRFCSGQWNETLEIFLPSNLETDRLSTALASCKRSQQDALFLNFIFIYNSTCFGQTYCPSSGVLIPYSAIGICHAIYVDYLLLLWIQYQDSCRWTLSLSETCSVIYQNKVEKWCILLASIIRIYHDTRSSECQRMSNTALAFLNILLDLPHTPTHTVHASNSLRWWLPVHTAADSRVSSFVHTFSVFIWLSLVHIC